MKTSKAAGPVKVFRILLVDDNRNGLLARKSVLEENGYQVNAYSSPQDALAEFCEQTYDLVVTDYRMPRMNGAQLIAEMREITPKVPIVLISGVVDVLGLDEKTTGANVVIPKSATEVTHLIRAVKRLLTAQPPKKPARSQSGEKLERQAGSQRS
jgi:CheY-like chemotaxis protein